MKAAGAPGFASQPGGAPAPRAGPHAPATTNHRRLPTLLAVLKIRDLALVDSLVWEVGPGLVSVTGETGAGKSVIVGAVKLVLGERADRSLVRAGADACSVEALFDLAEPGPVDALLEAAGLDRCEDGQLVVRRVVAAAGGAGNKQFVNGSPCTLAALKAIGHHLVDLHGPHDHQSLLSRERQLRMLDAFAGAGALREKYGNAYSAWQRLRGEHAELLNSERESAQELDLLKFQVGEIEDADLRPGEEAEIEARYRVAANAQRLISEANAAVGLLGEINGLLGDLQRHLTALNRTDPGTADSTAGANSAAVELNELESTLTDYLNDLELDPAEAAALERRLDLLNGLKRKYGNTVEEVIAHGEAAAAKLARTENRAGELERLEREAGESLAAARKAGAQLGKARAKAAPVLAEAVSGHLAELGFARALFEVALESDPDAEPGPSGLEGCEFVFAPNPGEPSKPLRQTASSGEMSRTMLALKSALVKEDSIPLLIFDEIDANVGGEIATAVGKKMAELGRSHQVVSITHLPQVASLATSHYVVTKNFAGQRTTSSLTEVTGDGRVAELARMLGGDSKSSRAHAKNLLGKR